MSARAKRHGVAAVRRVERRVPARARTLELAPGWRTFFQDLLGTPALESAIAPLLDRGGFERIMLDAAESRANELISEAVFRSIRENNT